MTRFSEKLAARRLRLLTMKLRSLTVIAVLAMLTLLGTSVWTSADAAPRKRKAVASAKAKGQKARAGKSRARAQRKGGKALHTSTTTQTTMTFAAEDVPEKAAPAEVVTVTTPASSGAATLLRRTGNTVFIGGEITSAELKLLQRKLGGGIAVSVEGDLESEGPRALTIDQAKVERLASEVVGK